MAAHGPFLWLVWFHQRGSARAVAAADENFGESTPPGKSAVSFYHITTGKGLGMTPLPMLPPLRDSLVARPPPAGGGGGVGH